jgi:PAS domain S-box-containing protein
MDEQNKTKEELTIELQELQQKYNSLKENSEKNFTERKQVENVISSNERELSSLMDNLPGMVYYCLNDKNWSMNFVNNGAMPLTGYLPNELIDNKTIAFNDIIHPDDRQTVFNKVQTALDKKTKYLIEYRIITKEGSIKCVWEQGHGVFAPDGELLTLQGFIIDITDQKKAKETLLESKENLSITLNSIGDGVISTDKSGLVVHMNPISEKLCGWKLADAIGKPLAEVFKIVNAETRKTVANQVNKVLENGEIVGLANHTVLISKNGSEYQITDSAAPIKTKQGEVRGVVLVFSDVTEKYRADKKLKESYNQFEMIINGANLGWWDWDIPSGDEIYNEILAKNLGYKLKEIEPNVKWWEGKIHPNDAEQVGKDLQEHFNGKTKYYANKHRLKTKSGKWLWFIDHGKVVEWDKNGKPIRMIGTLRDIDKQERTDEAIRESEEYHRALIENSNDGISVLNINGEIVFESESHKRLLGYEHGEIIGQNVFEFVHPDDSQRISKQFAALVQKPGTIEDVFFRFLNNNGDWVYLEGIGNNLLKDPVVKGIVINYHDVTKRKQAEDKSQHNSKLLRNVLDIVPSYICAKNIEGKFILVNKTLCDFYGTSVEDMTGILHKDICKDEEELFSMLAADKEVIDNGKIVFIPEETMIKPDESIAFLETYKLPFTAYNEAAVLIVSNDITQRKQAEKALLESEKRFKNMADLLPQVVFELDAVGKFTYINRLGLKMFGYSSMNLGMDAINVISPRDRKSFFAKLERVLQDEKDLAGEIIAITSDGREFPALIYASPIISESKQTGLRGILIDITQRKQDEESLMKLKTAIEKSEVSFVITNSEGIIEYANPFFTTLTGYSADEYIGKNPRVLKTDYHSKEFYEEMWNTLVSGKTWEGEFYNRKKNGGFYWENAIISPIKNDKNVITHFVAIKTDITETKKINSELIIAKEQAQESDRLKSAFLANMSHEIRTPMNGILGFSGLLKEPGLTGNEQQQYINIIEKAGARMLNIINDIISISKIESGQMEVNLQESNINEQLEYIYTFFKPETEAKGMQLFFKNTLPAKEAIIKTDREKVFAILSNLVKNAIKYTNDGFVELGCKKKGDYLEFFVKDTGIGIPKDRQEAIFERFIQADIDDKMARQGAGLGLSISKAYIEILGGKIWVESEDGVGSIFYFTLPCHAEQEENIGIENVLSSDKAENMVDHEVLGLKILIAEDDEPSDSLITIIVKNLSSKIIKAITGIEAVEACRNNPDIDLILMDIQMPEMNGYEATKEIRQFNKDVIIIAQTAYGLSGDRENALEAGCNDYISKPINKTELLSLLHRYFKK